MESNIKNGKDNPENPPDHAFAANESQDCECSRGKRDNIVQMDVNLTSEVWANHERYNNGNGGESNTNRTKKGSGPFHG